MPASFAKDLDFDLPPGLIGNPTVLPQCTGEEFTEEVKYFFETVDACPAETAVGVADVLVSGTGGIRNYPVPLFNLTPNVGEPARFGFDIQGVDVVLDTSVRTGGNYGVKVSVSNISQILGLDGAQVILWGTPGDPIHNAARGWECLAGGLPVGPRCPGSFEVKDTPFLTLPTSCTGPLMSSAEGDSWTEPGSFVSASNVSRDGAGEPTGLDGCGDLHFEPQIVASPDGSAASTPSGLNVEVRVPQEEDLAAGGLSEAEVKTTTVALPAGVEVSPGGADGLLSCSLAQIGLEEDAEQSCPEASKVGTVEINTPLLPNPLTGAVYLAAQNREPVLLAAGAVYRREGPRVGCAREAGWEGHAQPSDGPARLDV